MPWAGPSVGRLKPSLGGAGRAGRGDQEAPAPLNEIKPPRVGGRASAALVTEGEMGEVCLIRRLHFMRFKLRGPTLPLGTEPGLKRTLRVSSAGTRACQDAF